MFWSDLYLDGCRAGGVPQLRVEVFGPQDSYGCFGVLSTAAALQPLAPQPQSLPDNQVINIPVTFLVSVNKLEVTYSPRLPGPHRVHVNYCDTPVIGSPFHVQVRAGEGR